MSFSYGQWCGMVNNLVSDMIGSVNDNVVGITMYARRSYTVGTFSRMARLSGELFLVASVRL